MTVETGGRGCSVTDYIEPESRRTVLIWCA